MKKTIVGGIAAVAVAGGLAVAAPAGPAHADGYFDVCGPGYGVENDHTSCPFAFNVRMAWGGNSHVVAGSPMTGEVYEMECGSTLVTVNGFSRAGARCAGGNNAVVIVWPV